MAATVAPRTIPDQADTDLLTSAHGALRDELVTYQTLALELETTIADLMVDANGAATAERELAERARRRALEIIAEIQHAMRNLEASTYGTCERCGAAIARERLQAIPFTRHCVSCPPLPTLLA
jgi:RNA polymerase-binding transcription factor DksA